MSIQHSDLEVISYALKWLQAGHSVDLVTVVKTWGSSPRPLGSMAVVRDDSTLVGSVSGGCIEKQLVESFGRSPRGKVVTHQIDDEQAKRFGLSCGGQLELVFESLHDAESLLEVHNDIQERRRICRTLDTETGLADIRAATDGEVFEFDGRYLKKVFGPGWRLLLIGAGQLSRYTAEFALALDFEVIVCEPRAEFRSAWSVEGARLIPEFPDEAVLRNAMDANSAVLALTHDPNLDDMALMEALPGPAFYIGALGSKRNYQKRCSRLEAIGLKIEQIERLVGPIGLDIGSRTSAEIAVSIVAHLIKYRTRLSERKQ